MYNKLVNKEAKLALVGLGYVGLPIALEFAKKISVIGFDINEERLAKMREGIDPCKELGHEAFEETDIKFTSSIDELREASFFIVAVPTPIDDHNQPDLTPLLGATRSVAKALKKGDYVVYESTVYPGCTEEDCIPILEEISGLRARVDFKFGYSPERINPGEKVHTLPNTIKIVSGCDPEALDTIAKVYELVVKPGVHRAPNVKVAEAAKIIENTQRDVNIALMNELSIIFSRIGINTYDVLEAAGTKWNFLKFYPGLVGGHCIGVDPYYLVYKANELKYHSQIISAGRFINDTMGGYIAKKLVKKMIGMGKNILGARVLVMGMTFKENVADIRNSKVVDIISELKDFGVDVDVVDAYADSEEVKQMYGFKLIEKPRDNYDAVIVAVSHDAYKNLDEKYFKSLTYDNAVLVDVKGMYRGKIQELKYWSL
ncbi:MULTISPECIES: nucleotide sugar dehydrogenase [Porphyromonadaceae]|uniref:UDP-N-acetyl-D-galactosamine dehydrogenase n=1 Tax=Sanguibacteroides justesenii TaxID=1547597 RepID=A0AB34R7N5_9PORP|nr:MULTISPECIES: nucleotide sugar dehydrogenase [Porphyromonadaceae]KIO46933.1 UDP-N-acetyl-D-galactosamine dehydrogenase [Sanguibacteroides justesenii]